MDREPLLLMYASLKQSRIRDRGPSQFRLHSITETVEDASKTPLSSQVGLIAQHESGLRGIEPSWSVSRQRVARP